LTGQDLTLQDKLIELNRLDKRVRGLRTRLDANQRRHGLLERQLQQVKQQQHELDQRVKEHETKGRTFETEVKSMEDRVEQLRTTMAQISTNKEYQAVLVEVNTLKASKGDVEEQALQEMTTADEVRVELDAATTKVVEQEKLVAKAEADVEAAREEVSASLAEAEKEFIEAAGHLPKEVLKLYAKLSDDNDGDALGYVEVVDRKRMEYMCSVSNVMLPAEIYNSLLSNPNIIKQCPASHVILVLDAKVRDAHAEAVG